ncbi:type-2 ice-structuring protein-like [Scomber scombrus]|uniref:type-2 ice-structuring protein-like n=1 Tax=Scomber scombrus TaxID=13677 RepID=UPI002DDAC2C5|nr:type-2 ice-structuring protein-like [Scomber scombrus]XP_062276722.1 type-2 ice-structuring protein-like [Scomber scombrus]
MLTTSLLMFTMMALTRANNINSISDVTGSSFGPVPCPKNWTEYDGHCFQYVARNLSWAEAQKNCQSLNANLASIHSLEEYQSIQGLIMEITTQDTNTWIGGSNCEEEDDWFWADNTPFEYKTWCEGDPHGFKKGQCCLQINYGDNKCWHDTKCSTSLPSMCVKKPIVS